MSKKRRSSSQNWLQEYHSDVYVKKANCEGYRSRAVYKLAQIDARDRLFYSNMTVIDLGAAPGGWSQWVKQRLHSQVNLFALDIQLMDPLPDVTFLQGDFREQTILDELIHQLGNRKANIVMSDMAPNITGIKDVDQSRVMLLAELARDFAYDVLEAQGHFLTKVFQGEGFDSYIKELRPYFKQVLIRKPKASRTRSSEVYVLAKHYNEEKWK
ncbi:SAM-dependent methyltransferase [Candidatus Parabeggiatoa sp. HSG14]|uniref:RlmE family RNA methyltransferase n=1 Tax=Candidatus Parabeggiatoa sp. HSG14 TaxID=3055593 RepID=UPI0025A8FBA0|nr:SAM-dependent methyltransferase [Thiotrichales bacterium HSG14]